MNKVASSFILLLVFVSCQKELTYAEYQDYVSDPENGLRKDVPVGDFELSVMYEPAELLIGKQNLTEDDAVAKNIKKYEHFQFKIDMTTGGNILLFDETQEINEVTRINHFGFSAQNDFAIVSNGDTTNCKLAHYSRNYNLSPSIDLTLAFDKLDREYDWQFIYSDKQFNLGRTKFLFSKDDLADLPSIK